MKVRIGYGLGVQGLRDDTSFTSVQVLPGRNPVLVAKEWASLDGSRPAARCPRSGSALRTRASNKPSVSNEATGQSGSTKPFR